MKMTLRDERVDALTKVLQNAESDRNKETMRRLAQQWELSHDNEVRSSHRFHQNDYFKFRLNANLSSSHGTYDEIFVIFERAIFCVNHTLLSFSFRVFDESIELHLHIDENLPEQEREKAHAIIKNFLCNKMGIPD